MVKWRSLQPENKAFLLINLYYRDSYSSFYSSLNIHMLALEHLSTHRRINRGSHREEHIRIVVPSGGHFI